MADLVPVVASVKHNSGNPPIRVIAGDTITRGAVVYKNDSDNQFYLADGDALASAAAAGIAMTDGYDNGEMSYAPDGATIDLGVSTIAGTPYCVSLTAGKIAPYADLATGDFPTFLFWGTGNSVVTLNIAAAGVAKP